MCGGKREGGDTKGWHGVSSALKRKEESKRGRDWPDAKSFARQTGEQKETSKTGSGSGKKEEERFLSTLKGPPSKGKGGGGIGEEVREREKGVGV